jgi:LPXTG-motif cell wall-anchored protein
VITAASISPYNTTGNFTIGYDTTTSESITGGGGNIVATQSSTTAATYTVIYNYTIPQTGSPEPATMTLFGSALLGIGFFARKRFVKK